jgi:hypothetical protein
MTFEELPIGNMFELYEEPDRGEYIWIGVKTNDGKFTLVEFYSRGIWHDERSYGTDNKTWDNKEFFLLDHGHFMGD